MNGVKKNNNGVIKCDDWHGCYAKNGWLGGELTADSFQHPAKVSFLLAERIYQHAKEEGWIREGETVLDPFAGIGGFAFHALQHGLNWVGVELENRFCELAEQNIQFWNERYNGGAAHNPRFKLNKWGTARIIQGDSRKLCEVLRESAVCSISSPPFMGVDLKKEFGSDEERENFIDGMKLHREQGRSRQAIKSIMKNWSACGTSPGQLGAMPAGGFDAAVSSPPYAESLCDKPSKTFAEGVRTNPRRPGEKIDLSRSCKGDGYAENSPGQLGAMPAGQVRAAISSPPYESTRVDSDFQRQAQNPDLKLSKIPESRIGYGEFSSTSRTRDSIDTFWGAARLVVEQVHQILKPGGHAIWVVKDFVKARKRVEFCRQWQSLCESVGFETLHVHRAWVVENHGVQDGMFGTTKEYVKSRKSFFRRLAESKGSPRIDWEEVICQIRV